MEVEGLNIEVQRVFQINYAKGPTNRHFPLNSTLWKVKVEGKIWQEGIFYAAQIILAFVCLIFELAGNLIALLLIATFYLSRKVIDFIFWFIKMILENLVVSLAKGVGMLSIAFALFLIFYLYNSGKWEILYAYLQSLLAFLQ